MNLLLDLTAVTYRDLNQFIKLASENKDEAAFGFIQPAIASWDYTDDDDFNIKDPEAYAELPVGVGIELMRSIVQAIGSEDSFPLTKFSVDLNQWRVKDFNKFRKAVEARDENEIERLIGFVTKYDGKPITTFTAFHVLGAIRAIGQAYQKMASAGN